MTKRKKYKAEPRSVKCYATGEYGLPGEFIKRDGRWWKDQKTYDEYQIELMYYHKTYDMIANLLGYQPGQVFPTIVGKKLKELEFYGYACIYKTFVIQQKTIIYWVNSKDFDTDYSKIGYIFAIIKNNINDVYRKMQNEKRQQEIRENTTYDAPDDVDAEIQSTPQDNKNISKWLEDDE